MDKSHIMEVYEAICNEFPNTSVKLEFMHCTKLSVEDELIEYDITDADGNQIEYYLSIADAVAIETTVALHDIQFLLKQEKYRKEWIRQFSFSRLSAK